MKTREKGTKRRIFAIFLCLCVLLTAQPEIWNGLMVFAANESDAKVILSFAELPEGVKKQTVSVGTLLDELDLPQELTVCLEAEPFGQESEERGQESTGQDMTGETGHIEEMDTASGDGQEPQPEENEMSGDGQELQPEEDAASGDGQEPQPEENEASGEPDETTVADDGGAGSIEAGETAAISGVTWQSDPAYDGNTKGTYLFTAVLPEGYAPAEGVILPQIAVTVRTESADAIIQALLERIAALLDVEEYLAAEPDSGDYGDDYEEAYAAWMEGLHVFVGEVLAIQKEIEELTEEEKAQIPPEAADKLAAWAQIAEALSENALTTAAVDSNHADHAGWTKLTSTTTALTAGKKYYLEGDIALNAALSISGSGTVDLCLNGHNLTSRYVSEKTWLITVPAGATLNVYDCNGNGRLDAGEKQTGGISVSGTLNVYEGSICGKITSRWFQENLYKSDPMALAYSSAVYACGAGAAVNLYGGSIEGNAATCVYVDSGARLVVEGGNVNSTIDCTTNRDGNVGVQVAAIYVNQGAAAEVKAGRVSATTISGETLTSGSKNGSIMVMPTGSITISGGTVESVGENCGGIYLSEDVYWLENFTVAEGTTYANISGGTINGTVGARGDDIEVTVTGGEITEYVSLFGAAKLKMEGSQKIGTASAETEDIDINRLNNGKGYGTVVLTGALTNSVPYLVGTYRTPSSQYPIVFTENFTTYMSGKTPTEYFKSVNGYKVVLLNGEAALMPYVMTFDANGGACETKTGDINGGNPLRGSLPEPTREHYRFDGWYTQKDGGDEITIDAMPSGQDMTVYAHWTPVDYAITYDLADGALQDGDSNPASYHIETPDFTLKNPVRAGYVFTGWSGTGLTGEANKNVTVPKGSTGERAYTAHWEEAKYRVTVNTYKDGALWSSGAPAVKLTVDSGSSFVTDLTAVGNGSYRIYSDDDDTGVTVTVDGADATARVDYYTLSFYDGDRKVAPSQTVLKGKNANPCVLTKTGYQFAGWCGDKSLSGTPVTDISAPIITEQKIFYAKWTAKTYKVTFDDQGATGGNVVGNQTVTYDAAYGELPAPTKTGYVFKGWYTSQNGQGKPVNAATIVRTASDHTLYAYWKDEKAPDQPILQDGVTLPVGWTNTQTAIPLKLYDSVGVTGLLVSVDGSPYVEVSNFAGGAGSVNYSYTAVREGEHTYRFKAKDAAGNTSAESDIYTVKLDQTKPVIGTITYENKAANLWDWIIGKTSMIIHVPVTDAGSGVTGISYTMTPGDAVGNPDSSRTETKTAAVADGEAKITFDADFRGAITMNCTDAAGNAADSVTIGQAAGGVIVEDRAPDITVQADRNLSDTQQTQPGGVAVLEGYYDSAPALIVTVRDDTDHAVTAGIAAITYQVGDGAEKSVAVETSALQEQMIFTIPASEIPTGITQIMLNVSDNAGNQTKERLTIKVKGPEKQPAAKIDYREEKLTGLVADGIYSIDGTEFAADEKGCIPIGGSWFGAVVSIVRKGNGSETTDSPPQSLSVPARPQKPAPAGVDVPSAGGTGRLRGLAAGVTYEVSADGGKTWLSRTADESGELTGLAPGTYVVRVKAEASNFASESSEPAAIGAFQVKVTFLVNGENYREISVDYAAALTDIPDVPPKKDAGDRIFIAEWCSDEQGTPAVFTNVTADMTVYAVYTAAYTVTLQGGTGYILSAQTGSTGVVKEGGSFTFRVVLAGGYEKTDSFAVKADGAELELAADETYTISDIRKNYTVMVEGVRKKDSGNGGSTGGGSTGGGSTGGGSTGGGNTGGGSTGGGSTGGGSTGGDNIGGDRPSGDEDVTKPEDDTKPGDNTKPGGNTKPGDNTKPGGNANSGGVTKPEGNANTVDRTKPETNANTVDGTKPEDNANTGDGTKPGDNTNSADRTTPENDARADADTQSGDNTKTGEASPMTGGDQTTVPVTIEDSRIVVDGDSVEGGSIATGNLPGMAGAMPENGTTGERTASTILRSGNGAVIVSVVCKGQDCTAGVADTVAVANAAISPEQIKLVNDGENIEIRIDVEDISDQVPAQDQKVIADGMETYQKDYPGLVLGKYVDLSMYIRIGAGDWNTITETRKPVEVVIGVPEELQEPGRAYYIIRAHEGEHTFLDDMDDTQETITISTGKFSSYAIAYVNAGKGKTCGLCHICPTFLGICYFVWLAIILVVVVVSWIIVRRNRREQKND